ncbi:MAG: hypothetical protein Q9174_002165 [Haloplaca sp. 1 TL-2023]
MDQQQQQQHNAVHPQEHHNIDPAIAGPGMMHTPGADSGGDGNQSDGKKGKRELSTSKRAAQNRAAQRAFRQRKEGHIRQLESQVKEHNDLIEMNKTLQSENYALRDYIISLQGRLIESHGEFPQPPPNLEISPQRPSTQAGQHYPAPTAPMASSAVNQLQASAAQVIGLSSAKHSSDDAAATSEGSPVAKKARLTEYKSEVGAESSAHRPPVSGPGQ